MSDGTAATDAPLALEHPPSLRRFGPASISLEDESGRGVGMTHRSHHVRHGAFVWLRVSLPRAEERSTPLEIAVDGGDGLPRSPCSGDSPAHSSARVYVFRSRLGLKGLVPARAELMVTVAPSDPSSVRLVLPVVVWPSWWRHFCWAFAAVVPVVTGQFLRLLQAPEATPSACLHKLLSEKAFLSEAAAGVLLLFLGLRGVSLAWLLWGGPRE